MKYLIAKQLVEMDIDYEPLFSQAKDYVVETSDEAIKLFKADKAKKEEAINKMHAMYNKLNIGECEYMMYGSLFYNELIKHNGIMLHSSCVVKDGFAYLFSAPSGTGKSTHTSLWLKYIEGSFILNDDKPALIIENNQVYACGTPFSGKTNQNKNLIYPIKGICFIERSKDNWIKEINTSSAIFNILNQTIRPNDETLMDKEMDILDTIVSKVKIYKMGCNISSDACFMSYNRMK